jgi:putative ABC transport system permease protein
VSLSDTSPVARRRRVAPHTSMFLRMLMRAAVLRRGRAASALLAMVVAAAVATAMLNLYVDVQAKLGHEFRKYGANVVVIADEGHSLSADVLEKVRSELGKDGIAVPFAYAVARTADGRSVVVVGTDLEKVRKLNGSWWSVTDWPTASHDALLGVRAAGLIGVQAKPFDLSFQARTIHLNAAGILNTGAAEDSRVYLSLADFTQWTAVPVSTIEISASGSSSEVNSLVARLAQGLPGTKVQPIRQVTEGEANVLGKMRATLFVAATLIIFTAALCVLSTLTGWVADRRRDFALMKALGASAEMLHGFFAAEAATIGAIGATLGFVIGIGAAMWIGRANFHAPVTPRLGVFPVVFFGGVAISLMAAILPITRLRRVQPATILRGE